MNKIIALLMFCFLISCDDKPDILQVLETEVMAIHDEVMPKMSDIHKSRKQLQIALSNGADSTMVFTLLQKLDHADESMMVWMNEYKPMGDKVEREVKEAFLKDEKNKIIAVKDKMLASISDVEKFVEPYLKQNKTSSTEDTN